MHTHLLLCDVDKSYFFKAVMSADTTMYTMKRSIELGARFLAKKPLDATTIHNMWQHLDVKVLRLNRMKYLFQG